MFVQSAESSEFGSEITGHIVSFLFKSKTLISLLKSTLFFISQGRRDVPRANIRIDRSPNQAIGSGNESTPVTLEVWLCDLDGFGHPRDETIPGSKSLLCPNFLARV